jgi:hypothetical protein
MVRFMQRVSEELAQYRVSGIDGQRIEVGSFWKEGPAILVFLRHYG